ncbi:hypothetical protein ACQEU5_09605 [Marinactinospora thermotolerans]|uniref:Uncharacterized protein n=1 Tax=Marinactinospora thermotolerans DSM 45154 TaxID=1122192 RepID=A0A1T4T1B8_9ACTN|nr:hypothetical protein [Marinactinospora thermotolerans]SKA34245.1 hypothetical protein SAMN02745673_04267 [Marinactinospora thermotolerans DSM 45154]
MPDIHVDDSDVRELARRLREARPGDWREGDLRRVAATLGWEWDEGTPPRLRTGLPAGDAWLRPVGRYESDYTDTEEFVGLHVPLARIEGGPQEKAHAFARAAGLVHQALGRPASIIGSYGNLGPFFDSPPGWGAPFRRWRDQRTGTTLEVHAGAGGPELLLFPNDPVEGWMWRQGHGAPYALSGFFATSNAGENAGLGIPGKWRAGDWAEFARTLADFLRNLPAETLALGIGLSLGVHGRIPGTHGPWVFHIACEGTLELAVYPLEGEGINLASLGLPDLGWISAAERPARLDHLERVAYHSDGFAPGEADGTRLAWMLVETAKALGIPSPGDLSLIDSAETITVLDGEGGRHRYQADYYGLTLSENP